MNGLKLTRIHGIFEFIKSFCLKLYINSIPSLVKQWKALINVYIFIAVKNYQLAKMLLKLIVQIVNPLCYESGLLVFELLVLSNTTLNIHQLNECLDIQLCKILLEIYDYFDSPELL